MHFSENWGLHLFQFSILHFLVRCGLTPRRTKLAGKTNVGPTLAGKANVVTVGNVRLRFLVTARANYSTTIQWDSQSYFASTKHSIKVCAMDTCCSCEHGCENGGIAVGARKVLAFVASFSPNPSLHVNLVTHGVNNAVVNANCPTQWMFLWFGLVGIFGCWLNKQSTSIRPHALVSQQGRAWLKFELKQTWGALCTTCVMWLVRISWNSHVF